MSKKFFCRDTDANGYDIPNSGCGEIPHIIFDGYGFGDRQFEGVMFKAMIVEGLIAPGFDSLVVDSVDDWNTDPYLGDFNKSQIIKRATNYIRDHDVATCPKCGNDVDAQPK